jgi:hypothetical protein
MSKSTSENLWLKDKVMGIIKIDSNYMYIIYLLHLHALMKVEVFYRNISVLSSTNK